MNFFNCHHSKKSSKTWGTFLLRDLFCFLIKGIHGQYFTKLDFPEIRGFPFLSYLLGAPGRVRSLFFRPDLLHSDMYEVSGLGDFPTKRHTVGRNPAFTSWGWWFIPLFTRLKRHHPRYRTRVLILIPKNHYQVTRLKVEFRCLTAWV